MSLQNYILLANIQKLKILSDTDYSHLEFVPRVLSLPSIMKIRAQANKEGISNEQAMDNWKVKEYEDWKKSKNVKDYSAEEMINIIEKKLNNSNIRIQYIPFENSHLYNFGTTPPKNGGIYLLHPFISDILIPIDEYDLYISKERIATFKELSASLGAKKVTIKKIQANKSESTHVADIEYLAYQAGINIEFDKNQSLKEKTYLEFGQLTHYPTLPKNEIKKKWIDFEPDLRAMIDSRFNYNLLKQSISLNIANTSVATASIKASVKELGNGNYTYKNDITIESQWFFEIEFYPFEK